MRLYSIHLRRHGLDGDRDIAVVKEGFSWPAFLFSFLWALWHRLWLAAGLFLAAQVVLSALALAVEPDPLTQVAVSLGLAVIIGFVANDLRRYKLERLGFAFAGVAEGDDADTALKRFFESEPALAAELNA